MRTIRRMPWLPSVLGAIALVVGVAAGVGGSDGPERSGPRSAATITATGFIGSASSAPETRLQREIESAKGQRITRHDGLSGPASAASPSRAWVRALAAVLERAGHPERVGQISLRGPPAASA